MKNYFVNSETFILHLQVQHYCSLYYVSPVMKNVIVHFIKHTTNLNVHCTLKLLVIQVGDFFYD